MATHMQHESSFINEMVKFVQPTSGTTGIVIILRLPEHVVGQIHRLVDEVAVRQAQGTFDSIMHETLTEILAVARTGPGTFVIPDDTL